jgi:hypothetical protein
MPPRKSFKRKALIAKCVEDGYEIYCESPVKRDVRDCMGVIEVCFVLVLR